MKRYADTNKIQPMHIREFIGTLEYHKIDIGIYITTGFGTSGIHDYIRTHDTKKILFIDKDELVHLINKAYQKK
jgi:restriction endonuclease Mrr